MGHHIDPAWTYWPSAQSLGPMARGSSVTHVATQVRPMSRLITRWSLGDSNP
jgi:hypothetical protein